MADSIRTICATVLTGIRASNTVSAAMTATFSAGTTLNLFLGLDAKNLPPESSVPWCAAIPQAYGRMDDYDHRENQITMAVAIKKTGFTGSPATAYQAMDGLTSIQTLTDAIVSATETAIASNMLSLSDIQLETDYPFYRASWSFRVPTAL